MIDDDDSQRELEPRPDPAAMSDREWDEHMGPPNFRKHATIADMDVRTYNAWCNAGKPDLQPRAATLPATSEKRTGEARGTVSRHELRKFALMVAEESGKAIGELRKQVGDTNQLRKDVGELKADKEYNRGNIAAVGKEVDRLKAEVFALKREAELAAKLEIQRDKRRLETLESENRILAAGRRPNDGEDELPAKFSEWGRHAQQ